VYGEGDEGPLESLSLDLLRKCLRRPMFLYPVFGVVVELLQGQELVLAVVAGIMIKSASDAVFQCAVLCTQAIHFLF
jgi:hypothetical protein